MVLNCIEHQKPCEAVKKSDPDLTTRTSDVEDLKWNQASLFLKFPPKCPLMED